MERIEPQGFLGYLAYPAEPAPYADWTEEEVETPRQQTPKKPKPKPPIEPLPPADVLWAMLNDVVGKDKLAKFTQYTLRLLLHHLQQAQDYFRVGDTSQFDGKFVDVLVNFIRNPRGFGRVLVYVICSAFSARFAPLVPALGTFRQILRFGKSPFRVRSLLNSIKANLKYDSKNRLWRVLPQLFSQLNLSNGVLLWYNVSDELTLLYKLGFLKHDKWQSWAARHEAYAWYCELWLALYTAYTSLSKLAQQEMDARILIQVKKRARALSRQLLGGQGFGGEDELHDVTILKEVQFQKANVVIDIYKTLLDIVFNTYTVFRLPLPFQTVQIWMGILASFLSIIKLFREKRRR